MHGMGLISFLSVRSRVKDKDTTISIGYFDQLGHIDHMRYNLTFNDSSLYR